MTDREKAIEYLVKGHGLLRKYGLYGSSDDQHFFAIDRTISNLEPHSRETINGVAEAAAALQALYEAKRLVTARSSIEGRRIILGDWFMSLAVGLALPLRTPRLTAIITEELCSIGKDANRPAYRASKQQFCRTIDRFTEALIYEPHCSQNSVWAGVHGDFASSASEFERNEQKILRIQESPETSALCSRSAILDQNFGSEATKTPRVRAEQCMTEPNAMMRASDNMLINALCTGYYKTTAAEVRSAIEQMESWFAEKYASEGATEMDGWIHGAIMSGGKRLRPMLVRLCAGLGPDKDDDSVISIMSTIELMHSASLVHDDIVDRSPLRRSRATINAQKGDGYAAMCGFRMIADSIELCNDGFHALIVDLIAEIPMKMCAGELHQFDLENKPELQSEAEYLTRIGSKTATLIEGSCACGAILGGATDNAIEIARQYGHALGMLFQLRDDLLDYSQAKSYSRRKEHSQGMPTSSKLVSGKPVSQDMERGIYTLPLLFAREKIALSDMKETAKLETILRKEIKSAGDIDYLNEIAHKFGGIDYCVQMIEKYRTDALSALAMLPHGPYVEALALLVDALADSAGQSSEKANILPLDRQHNDMKNMRYAHAE